MSAEPLVSDRATALEFLVGRINYERTSLVPYESGEFKLDRMRRLLAELGNPHLGLKVAHIAGTKGKGSTAWMLASILRESGYRVGLYTSPHLELLEERFVINGQLCSDQDFVSLTAALQTAVETLHRSTSLPGDPLGSPTFFEITTAMALLHFARQNVDCAVLEVGLGGRLDSTNVCLPEVCVITTISFDHTRQLGNTLALIAREKAGIIKPGIPVVSGVTADEPRHVIEKIAAENGAPLYLMGRDYQCLALASAEQNSVMIAGEQFTYCESIHPQAARRESNSISPVTVSLLGRHQAENAAGAVCAAWRLAEKGWKISQQTILRGLANCHPPARIETVSVRPTTIVDVAHNVASIAAVAKVLDQRFSGERKILIFACSRDKDSAGMLDILLPWFDQVILTMYVNNPRAYTPDELLEQVRQWQGRQPLGSRCPTIETAPNPPQAWDRAQSLARPTDLVCATGSFFLAAELRQIAQGL